MTRINRNGYAEKVNHNSSIYPRPWQDWFPIIGGMSRRGDEMGILNLERIEFPKEAIGKKARLKIEFLEDTKETV